MTTETETMSIADIYELLAELDVNPREFWAEAMGGDRAALPREDVMAVLDAMDAV